MEDRNLFRIRGTTGCTASGYTSPYGTGIPFCKPNTLRKKIQSGQTNGTRQLHLLHHLTPGGARSRSAGMLIPGEMKRLPTCEHSPEGKPHKGRNSTTLPLQT